ncbi:gamma-glutamylcyclotransferase family protein [Caminibacter sp.]
MPLIFVYGSLKKGKKLHNYLKNSLFLGNAKTLKKYPLILSRSKWYPYLIEKEGIGYQIKGEVYKIDFKTLKILDRVEEAPYYYYRKTIPVILNGKKVLAYTYFVRKPLKFNKKELIEEF